MRSRRGSVTRGVGPAAPHGAWRQPAVFAIKLVHTAIFALVSTCVLYVFVAGVTGRGTRFALPAGLIVLAEMVVYAGNRWRCPLTELAERVGADSGRVTDIFLPRWFADRIPQIYTPPFVVGFFALLWRRSRGRSA